MQFLSKNIVFGRVFASSIIAAMGTRAAAALIVTPKVRLTTLLGFNPQPSMLLADLVANEAAWTGYTSGGYAPTFSAEVNLGPNIVGLTANVVPISTGVNASPGNTCYGWWMDDGTNVIMAEAFGQNGPIIFAAVGDYLDLQVSFPQDLFQATA